MADRSVRLRTGVFIVLGGLIGRLPIHALRVELYRRILHMRIGRTTTVYRRPEIYGGRNITIGESSIIGKDAILDGRFGLVIGNNVNLSSEVAIWTAQHDWRSPTFAATGGQVEVGDYAWLSFRSTVLPGVRVGRGAVVAAGAVVTTDVPDYAVVAGVPAQQVATRPSDLRYHLRYRVPFL